MLLEYKASEAPCRTSSRQTATPIRIPTTVAAAGVLGNDTDADAGDTKSVSAVNGVAADVGTQITLGSGADIPKALEGTVKPILEEVWKYNDLNTFLYNMATVGAVTGDAFVLVTFAQPTDLARARNPNSQGQIRVDLLGSEQCFPTWDPLNTDIMTSIRIETVFYDHDTRMRGAEVQEQPRQGQSNLTIRRFTQTITNEWIIEQFEGSPPVFKPNTLGAIPVVHVQNLPIAREFFGISELDNVMTLQQEINEKTTDQSDIIHYHAGPITIITGGKGAALEYGPNKIWSGFPEAAKIFNLEMTTDLGAIQAYIEFTRKTFLELTETPEILFTTPEISNTSRCWRHCCERYQRQDCEIRVFRTVQRHL